MTEPWMAASHALQVAEVVARFGVTSAQLFAGFDVNVDDLADPGRRVPLSAVQKVAARAIALSGEPGLGFYLGLSMRASSHGYVGFAAMSARTLREALELAVRFAPTRSDVIGLSTEERGEEAAITIEERAPLGDARELIITSFVVGLHEIAAAITGRRVPDRAEVALAEPAHAKRFRHVLGDRIRWGRPAHRLVFDASALDWPLVQADPAALRLAREQCERELDALRRDGHAARVRSAVAGHGGAFRSIDETASALGLSVRTLKRRLAEEGTTFSAVLDEQKAARARTMLESHDTTIDAVASSVGYSDVANFTRAFRRWTGTTPASYRKSHGAAS